MIPIFDLDEIDELDKEVDIFLADNHPVKYDKMYKASDVIDVIKDCIDRPKGVVPNSVYDLLQDDVLYE